MCVRNQVCARMRTKEKKKRPLAGKAEMRLSVWFWMLVIHFHSISFAWVWRGENNLHKLTPHTSTHGEWKKRNVKAISFSICSSSSGVFTHTHTGSWCCNTSAGTCTPRWFLSQLKQWGNRNMTELLWTSRAFHQANTYWVSAETNQK